MAEGLFGLQVLNYGPRQRVRVDTCAAGTRSDDGTRTAGN